MKELREDLWLKERAYLEAERREQENEVFQHAVEEGKVRKPAKIVLKIEQSEEISQNDRNKAASRTI